MSECIVYWLYDDNCCICPWRHGYVGISAKLRGRLKYHQRNLSQTFDCKVLFVGTRAECRALEYKLRSERNIGWNYLPGGGRSPRAGVIIPEDVRRRMSEAARKRQQHQTSDEMREKARLRMIGTTNKSRTGQKKSEAERQKISLRLIGKPKNLSDETRRKLSARMLGTAYHFGYSHTEETKRIIKMKKTGIPVHSDEHKRKLAERMKGNAFTKGKPWSAARRIAWLQQQE